MAGPVWALGAMSGTSMDGVDAAMVLTDGVTVQDFGPAHYLAYCDDERAALRAAQGHWPGEDGVADAAEVVESAHIRLLSRFDGAEVVGFHGQTLAHDPERGRTHQAGDGSRLARSLGLPVVWDFRSADVKLGGQGAPLAPFFHFALARRIGAVAPVAFLNLGGIGNLTWVDPAAAAPEASGALLAFDTGPANAQLDDLMLARTGAALDRGGAAALAGRAVEAIVEAALSRSYFARIPPKSLDRADFADLAGAVAELSLEDAAATLVAVAGEAVARGLVFCPRPPSRVLVGGGGRLNPAMMAALAARLPCPVQAVEEVGLDGDMLEAQAFAFLAVRVMRGMATSAPGTTGVAAAVGGGTVSRP